MNMLKLSNLSIIEEMQKVKFTEFFEKHNGKCFGMESPVWVYIAMPIPEASEIPLESFFLHTR